MNARSRSWDRSIPFYAASEGTLTAWAVLALALVVFALMLGGCS